MPAEPRRGEVWIADLGYVAKTRPCVVLSVPVGPEERALITFVPRTTSLRGTRYEVRVDLSCFSEAGAFDAQGIATIDRSKFRRKLATLNPEQLVLVENSVREWLALPALSGQSTPRAEDHLRGFDFDKTEPGAGGPGSAE